MQNFFKRREVVLTLKRLSRCLSGILTGSLSGLIIYILIFKHNIIERDEIAIVVKSLFLVLSHTVIDSRSPQDIRNIRKQIVICKSV